LLFKVKIHIASTVPGNPKVLALITCMFVHSGWFHLIGNMLFLYLAGCSIEDLWGRPLYIVFYLVSGIVATLMHALKFPTSAVPMVGASGAIAGLMGAFLFRLYNTKINFFWLYWFFVIRRGTFSAPAYVVLPLWLFLQLLSASADSSGGGVAFWAHIGGFLFGFGIAYLIKISKLEEKFIAPGIAKKVSIVQTPDFLRAMEISERGDYPNALILLEKVVRQDPSHLDAYMEMRRIAEVKKDPDLYTKYSAAIFDILIRSKDWDLFDDLYRQFHGNPLRQVLPAKTIFGIAGEFEELQDYSAALQLCEELGTTYPADPLALKAWNKVYKICFDRLALRDKGIQAFWKCSQHQLAGDQWKSVLESDAKRYSIPAMPVGVVIQPLPKADILPSPSAHDYEPLGASVAAEEMLTEKDLADAVITGAVVQSMKAPMRSTATKPVAPSIDPPLLPNSEFDSTGQNGMIVPCRFVKLTLRGMIVNNAQSLPGLLLWKRIDSLSVAKIRNLDPANPRGQKDVLLVDLIVKTAEGMRVYRMQAENFPFEKIFPGVEQTFAEAYQNFIGIVLNNSGARCIPNRESCNGPNFQSFPEEERYNVRLKEKLQITDR
jgi:membrane associated rhomboid family serine protease